MWGCADFGGGSLTRRLPVLAVTVVSQAAGFVALLVALGVRGDLDGALVRARVCSAASAAAIGLAAFYKALSLGTMSVVSPIAACSAVVPFGVSLATGERPAVVAVVGAVLALAGAVLASVEERRSASPERARAIVLAGRDGRWRSGSSSTSSDSAAGRATCCRRSSARASGRSACCCVLAVSQRATLRLPARALGAVAAVGLADVSANALFAFASGHGLLALVSVLGSLYPVMTLLLAHVVPARAPDASATSGRRDRARGRRRDRGGVTLL